jgi:hypothetical protein
MVLRHSCTVYVSVLVSFHKFLFRNGIRISPPFDTCNNKVHYNICASKLRIWFSGNTFVHPRMCVGVSFIYFLIFVSIMVDGKIYFSLLFLFESQSTMYTDGNAHIHVWVYKVHSLCFSRNKKVLFLWTFFNPCCKSFLHLRSTH